MPPLQHGELLAEHTVFQEKISTATKAAKERAEPEQKQVGHGSEVEQSALGTRAVCR